MLKINNKKYGIWLYIFIILFVLLGLRLFTGVKGDFIIYHDSLTRSLEGGHEYAYTQNRDRFVYMPGAYLLLHPFGWFSLEASRVIHHVLESLLLLITCILFLELVSPGKKYPYIMGLTLLLTARYLNNNYGYGQVNIIILFNIVAAIFFFHRGKRFLPAIFLAVAISFKLTPVLFLVYFLVKREYRLVAWSVAAVLVLNFVVPMLFWGGQDSMAVYRAWFASQLHLGSIQSAKFTNSSVLSFLFRYLSEYSWSDRPGYLPVNFLSMSKNGVKAVYLLAAVPAITYFMVSRRLPLKEAKKTAGSNTFTGRLSEYSLVIMLMLLFSPVTWRHHFVLLFIPHFYLVHFLLKKPGEKGVLWLLLASFVLNLMSTPAFAGKAMSRVMMNYSILTVSAVLLTIAIIIASLNKHINI